MMKYVVCIDNTDYPASLETRKIYEVLPDEIAAPEQHLRIIDESGEDYLYPEQCFLAIELPSAIHEALSQHRE